MHLECVDELRLIHNGREILFEERAQFGYVYEVSDEVGKAAIASGQCREVKKYKGPIEIPSSKPVV